MPKIYLLLTGLLIAFTVCGQPLADTANKTLSGLSEEVSKLKEAINQLKNYEIQSERIKYQKNYQLILYAIEIIKEMYQGTVEISGARSQNMPYKKLIDINNPSSETLGFQLGDVIDKTLEDNLSQIPLMDTEKKRLKGQVSGFVDGIKRSFPPLQIFSSAISMISSFVTFKPRIEKIGRKSDSLIIDAVNPITKDIISRFNNQLAPYMDFYSELGRTNTAFENALYQHMIEYKDFIEEVSNLKTIVEKTINLNESIGEQINNLFDISNSSAIDFNYKDKNEDATIKDLTSNCVTVFDLVVRFKKFANDFIIIQDDFYRNNILILQQKAKALPVKDTVKIDKLIADLTLIKKGDPDNNTIGFDESYKMRLKSIATKLIALNKARL
jgi:hypothetical protein